MCELFFDGIPESVNEAAYIDGAGSCEQILNVTIPGIPYFLMYIKLYKPVLFE